MRHQPETIGIELDQNGWADIDELIEKSNLYNHQYGIKINRVLLNHIVATNAKQRFAINETSNKIRANQGHSIDINLGYINQKPPEILYHGTSKNTVDAILKDGLKKQNRQHVHLSKDIETAIQVGQRHGKPFVFIVLAETMYNDNYAFYISDNGVWLTDYVPVKYLKPYQ